MFALNLGADGRVLSATTEQFAAPGMPIVEALPDGDISDYLYRDGEFVFSPPPAEVPKAAEDVAAGTIFSIGGDLYRATMPIPRGEPVTRYNAVPVSMIDVMNALEAQKGD